MQNNNMIEYVTEGVLQLARKDYLYVVLGGCCVTFVSSACGFSWGYIAASIVMIAFALITSIAVLFLSCGTFTQKRRLILQIIYTTFWLLELNLMMTMVFIRTFGTNLCLLLLFAPNILQPIFMCLRKIRDFRKGYVHPLRIVTRLIALPIFSAIIVWLVYSHLDVPTEKIMVPVFLACFHFVSVAISSGLQSFQQLYYLNRFEKEGILPKGYVV